MKKIITLFCISIFFTSCTNDKENTSTNIKLLSNCNKVLILKVDFTTTTFEGGKEFTFNNSSPTFTTHCQYVSPGDFGSIKVFYSELNALLFYGDIYWMGTGEINFPTDFQPASSFEYTLTTDFYQEPEFENIFDPNVYPANIPIPPYDYSEIWIKIQGLLKVRNYRNANPNAPVKLFLYQPSVGVGDPSTWKWILFFKN